MPKKLPVSKKQPEKRKLRPIIILAIFFSIYGLIQATRTTSQDTFAVVFAWILFSIVWAIIAIMRYENLCGRC